MRSTFFPLELRCHTFFQFLLISTTCHNPLENHGRNEHHTFFIFTSTKAFWSSCCEREHHWSSHGAVAVTTASTKLHPPGFNNSQSNAPHMMLLHPPHPHIFNEATSSRFQQVSIQRSPHDVIIPTSSTTISSFHPLPGLQLFTLAVELTGPGELFLQVLELAMKPWSRMAFQFL